MLGVHDRGERDFPCYRTRQQLPEEVVTSRVALSIAAFAGTRGRVRDRALNFPRQIDVNYSYDYLCTKRGISETRNTRKSIFSAAHISQCGLIDQQVGCRAREMQ